LAVSVPDEARLEALRTYKLSLEMGAERETALHVALAKLRSRHPLVTEWEVRSWLVKGLAADTQLEKDRSPTD
jgi:hypothetical protein